MLFKKLLSVLFMIFALLLNYIFGQNCTPQVFNLLYTNQVLNLTSHNYPNAYKPGTNCRYRIVAPLDHVVVLTCRFELSIDRCGSEYLYISRDGDFQFRDGEIYCRAGNLRRSSNFRSIAFAYSSIIQQTQQPQQQQQLGRLHCQAMAQRQRYDCGWSLGTRIANGQEAGKHEYPAMVALRDRSSNQRVFCGGTIVSHRYIITAAHCTREHPIANRIVAYAGDHDLSSSTESLFAAQYPIQRIINHPAYTVTDRGDINDIALLITTRNIQWSRGVGPICLPVTQPTNQFAYENVDIVGWGTLGFAGSKSNTLQKITLLTLDNNVCRTQYNNGILSSQLCTYDFRGLGQDSCQYDSGGPVILRQPRMCLIGIVSFGRSCGQRYGIGVNTRITAYLRWLRQYVGG